MRELVQDVGGMVVDCGLDYLRVTALQCEPELPAVMEQVLWHQDTAENDGHKKKQIAAQGFVGSVCGGWRWGERNDFMLLEASSGAAPELLKLLKDSGLDVRGTRIDCAVTYERLAYDDEWPVDMRNLFREAEYVNGLKRPRRAAIVDNPKKGSTLELLSRAGRRFIRHYDKSAEQRHRIDSGIFRAEVEYKRDMARAMYRRALNAVDQRTFAFDAMVAEWRRLGIEPNYDMAAEPCDLSITRRKADADRTEQWLIELAAQAFHKLPGSERKERVLGAFFRDAAASLAIAEPEPKRVRAALSEPEPPKQRTEAEETAWRLQAMCIAAAHAEQAMLREVAQAKKRKRVK